MTRIRQADPVMNGFVKIGSVAELDPHGQFSRWVGNHDILVFRWHGTIRALSNVCPHFGGPVGYYRLRDGVFTCLWHNLQFAADTGRCLGHPRLRLREYRLEVKDGAIWALLVEEPAVASVEAAAQSKEPV
jgi:nitrite reductase/ring-hydroxylating ferredoxin subunit